MSEKPIFTLNDELRPWRSGLTVHELLHELDPAMPIAVVRIDGDHIARKEWTVRTIAPGEQVRVVYIIAGG